MIKLIWFTQKFQSFKVSKFRLSFEQKTSLFVLCQDGETSTKSTFHLDFPSCAFIIYYNSYWLTGLFYNNIIYNILYSITKPNFFYEAALNKNWNRRLMKLKSQAHETEIAGSCRNNHCDVNLRQLYRDS